MFWRHYLHTLSSFLQSCWAESWSWSSASKLWTPTPLEKKHFKPILRKLLEEYPFLHSRGRAPFESSPGLPLGLSPSGFCCCSTGSPSPRQVHWDGQSYEGNFWVHIIIRSYMKPVWILRVLQIIVFVLCHEIIVVIWHLYFSETFCTSAFCD